MHRKLPARPQSVTTVRATEEPAPKFRGRPETPRLLLVPIATANSWCPYEPATIAIPTGDWETQPTNRTGPSRRPLRPRLHLQSKSARKNRCVCRLRPNMPSSVATAPLQRTRAAPVRPRRSSPSAPAILRASVRRRTNAPPKARSRRSNARRSCTVTFLPHRTLNALFEDFASSREHRVYRTSISPLPCRQFFHGHVLRISQAQ